MEVESIFDMSEIMTIEKILIIIGGLLVVISVFLPYVTLSSNEDVIDDDSMSGMDENVKNEVKVNPIITLIFGLLCLVGGIINREFLNGYMPLIVIVLAIIALITIGVNIGDLRDDVEMANEAYDASGFDIKAGTGFGLYWGLAACLLVIEGGVFTWMEKKEPE